MRHYSEKQILRLGAYTLVVLLIIVAAAFNLSKFPGFRGDVYKAEFTDASGLHKGNMVQVGGMRSGRVQDVELDGAKVIVTFEVDAGLEFGKDSRASVEVLNLLGEKFLELAPAGSGTMKTGSVIPLERTEAAYDIVGVLGDLTTTTERIDLEQLKGALDTVGETLAASGPELEPAFRGISKLSETIASRDEQLQTLLEGSAGVTELLDQRSKDLVQVMKSGDLVFKELRSRKAAIHRLLVNARILATELRGVAADNQRQIGPALQEVGEFLSFLVSKEKQLKATLAAYGPYAEILGDTIGTGPWFDAYVVNLAGLATGEFASVDQEG
jgi:phospholipid/cholesterol/gamma-HCH transport system substrate-binding protein